MCSDSGECKELDVYSWTMVQHNANLGETRSCITRNFNIFIAVKFQLIINVILPNQAR